MLIEFSEADGYIALSSNQKMVLILHERKAQEFGDHAVKDQKQIQFSTGIPDLSLHEVLTVVIN